MVKSCCAYNCKQRFVKGGNVTFHGFPKNEDIKLLWLQNIRRKDFIPTQNSVLCSKHFDDSCFDKNRFGGTWLKPNAVPTIFDYTIRWINSKKPHPKKQLLPENFSIKEEFVEPMSELMNPSLQIREESDSYFTVIHTPTSSSTPVSSIIEPEVTVTVLNPNKHPIQINSNNFNPEESTFSPQQTHHEQYRSIEEFSDEDMNSPDKARRALHLAKNKISLQRHKMRFLTNKLRKSEQQVALLTSLVHQLQENQPNSKNVANSEEENLSPIFLNSNLSVSITRKIKEYVD